MVRSTTPAHPPQAGGVLDTAAGDPNPDAAPAQVAATARIVVSLVGVQLVRAPSGPARPAAAFAHSGVGVEQSREHGAVVGVGARDQCVQRKPVAIAQHVVLRARLAPVGGAWPCQLTLLLRPNTHAVHRGPRPVEQAALAQPVKHGAMQSIPQSRPLPLPQPPPAGHPGPAAQLSREIVPADAGFQHEDDAGERGSVRDPGAAGSPVLDRWSRRDQRLHQLPQLVTDQPLGARVCRHRGEGSPAPPSPLEDRHTWTYETTS
jgi:hypothetical protein